jgi:hypothetical protein
MLKIGFGEVFQGQSQVDFPGQGKGEIFKLNGIFSFN